MAQSHSSINQLLPAALRKMIFRYIMNRRVLGWLGGRGGWRLAGRTISLSLWSRS